MDDLSLNTDELRRNLDELVLYNQWLGGKKVLIAALNKIHRKYASHVTNKKITIADLGCGSGDLTRAIATWAETSHLSIELVGIDANPCMTQYASEQSQSCPEIHWKTINIFSPEFSQLHFDIVCLNSITHHFSDAELMQLLKQLAKQTRFAIIINDLQRHWLSYFAIKCITTIFPFSSLAKHDAPLSVLKAFRKQEWINLFKQADLPAHSIHWAWAFRWDIIVWLDNNYS